MDCIVLANVNPLVKKSRCEQALILLGQSIAEMLLWRTDADF